MSFQTHSPNINSDEGSKEFSFWTSPNTIITTSSEKCDCHNTQLLSGNETRVFNNHCSRSKDILEGKKELMDMMQDMSESCYELSFQDMVVEQHQVSQSEPETETESVCSKAQNLRHEKLKKKNKKKKENKSNSRHGKILRVESMDSETFLLKMFFPTSLDWMKKTTKVQNGSKVEQKDKEWRIKKFFTEDKKNTSSSSSSSNDKSR
ncbi:hypothetical protein TSUD_304000 [Trifolium subterraneum]|uniref:Uncharacterized protein n=1 Tax=Trifolium subterraneum TaxID=3900 RepID=A0A2Z6MMV9_TRISU|nr:hypothetical protein TSUD_304000 [Trifolium subterraneum]